MVPDIDSDSLPVPQAEGTTYRKDSSPSIETLDQTGSRRRHDRLPACSPPHGTSCVRGALSLPAGFDDVGRGAALPQIRRLPSTSTALRSSVFSPTASCGPLRRYLPVPRTRAMDKLSPVGSNRISSTTSSVSPLYVSLHAYLQARSRDEMVRS
uniref:Uncharacterized protein n=1 Tax=Triticum urartu TaxID=4572 RepID=A0A8R7K5N2_TRIUA